MAKKDLGELIRECDYHFYGLFRMSDGTWYAEEGAIIELSDGTELQCTGEGNTPEEAVEALLVDLKENGQKYSDILMERLEE